MDEVSRIMRTASPQLNDAARKAAATKEPADYKAWSDRYDALESEILAMTPEELAQVGGGVRCPPMVNM